MRGRPASLHPRRKRSTALRLHVMPGFLELSRGLGALGWDGVRPHTCQSAKARGLCAGHGVPCPQGGRLLWRWEGSRPSASRGSQNSSFSDISHSGHVGQSWRRRVLPRDQGHKWERGSRGGDQEARNPRPRNRTTAGHQLMLRRGGGPSGCVAGQESPERHCPRGQSSLPITS